MPVKRGPRSPPGNCPLCQRDVPDLLEHARQRHKDHAFGEEDFVGTEVKVCRCGKPALGSEGVRKHRQRSKTCQYADAIEAVQESSRSDSRPQEDEGEWDLQQPNPNSGERELRQGSVESIESIAFIENHVPRSRIPVSAARRRERLPTPPVIRPIRPRFPLVSPPPRVPVPMVNNRPRPVAAVRRPGFASFQFENDEAALDCLASLPTTYKQLPPSVAKAFSDAAERVANNFLAGPPSDKDVLDLLCLPKIGLAPGQATTARDRLLLYPDIPLPKVPSDNTQVERSSPSAIKQVEVGRLGHAARILGGFSSAPSRTAETIEILKTKHPEGPRNPFGPLPGPPQHTPPSTEAIIEALYAFKPDTAPGVSGWTVPLLKLAVRSDTFKKMLTVLVSMVLAGSAPGQRLLCSSRLVALEKPDGGVRPIAVGELIYRLCTKAVLRHTFKPDFLSAGQFGVGTKGGVEPLIRSVQRVVDGTVKDVEYTHVTSLDFSNAFNTLDRTAMAKAVKQHAPGLYRLAKWAYDKPSSLVIGGGGSDVTRIRSAQGVRQGDPLGPLLFSIGIRPILEKLSQQLGSDCIVLAYLGSCVGPSWARRAFLKTKVSELETKIDKLVDVPHQHALLLLRQCMQQDLRHLQRCLVTEDIDSEWERLDSIIWKAALRLRSSSDPAEFVQQDEKIISLPVKMGGLGLLSYKTCAPLAYAAASETSDKLLEPLLGPSPIAPTLTDPEDPESISPQRIRCGKAFEAQQEALFHTLDDHQIKTILESASGLGRKWLSVIPFHQALRITDFEVSAALHHRTLNPGSAVCSLCGVVNTAGHPEVCKKGTPWFVARHEQVKYAIKRALESAEGVRVAVEPYIADTNRRNDLRVTGSEASGLSNHEYDVTVVSLACRDSVETHIPPQIQPIKSAERGHAYIMKFLDGQAAGKRRRLPANNIPFTPLVFTVGGMMDDDTAKSLKAWQQSVTPSAFSTLCQQLSLILLRAKAKSFVL